MSLFQLHPSGDDATPHGPWATLAGARDAPGAIPVFDGGRVLTGFTETLRWTARDGSLTIYPNANQ